jgi:predicted DNA-binding protein with PD1-like motif
MLRLSHKGELVKELKEFIVEKRINSGVFTVIGAVESATLAYYDQKKREYTHFAVEGAHEIVHCFGNITTFEKQPMIHAHALLAGPDGNTIGGHLIEADVFAAEAYVQCINDRITRGYDPETGLNLMDLKQ